MFEVYVIFFTLFSTIIINYFLIKKKLLLDKKYSPHKSFLNNDIVPLSGGIIFLLSICIFYPSEDYLFKLTLFAIFLIGIFSDLNIISSPIKRITIQTFIILVFLYIDQTYIQSIRWLLLDHYLNNTIFGYLFSLVCLIASCGHSYQSNDNLNFLFFRTFFSSYELVQLDLERRQLNNKVAQ